MTVTNTFATHSGLVQNSIAHGRHFSTVERQFLTNRTRDRMSDHSAATYDSVPVDRAVMLLRFDSPLNDVRSGVGRELSDSSGTVTGDLIVQSIGKGKGFTDVSCHVLYGHST